MRPRIVSPVIGAALIVVAVVVMFVATLAANRIASTRSDELANDLIPLEEALTDAEIGVLGVSAEARAYVATADGRYRTRYEDRAEALRSSLGELEREADRTDFGLAVRAMSQATSAWSGPLDDAMALRRDGDQAGAEALLDTRILPERDRIVEEADALRANVRSQIDDLRGEIRDVQRAEEVVLAAAGLTGLIAAAVLMWLLIGNRRLEADLESERRRLHDVIGDVPGIVWEAWGRPDAASQRIDYVSQYVEEMLGYSTGEWLNTPNFWLTIVHPEDRQRAAEAAAAIFAGGEGGVDEFRWVAKDGHVIWALAYSSVIRDETGKPAGMRGVTIDVTERKRAEYALEFIAEAGRMLSSSLDYESTLQTVARLAVPDVADWCAVHVVGEDGTPEQVAAAHADPAKVEWALELLQRYAPDPAAPRGVPHVIRTGTPELIPVITDELIQAIAHDEEQLRILREMGFSSYVCVPMVARGRVLGAVTFVAAESGRHFGEADVELAAQLGRRAAMAVDNARLYRHAQAEQARFESIVASVDYGVLQLDAGGRLVYANPAATGLLGKGAIDAKSTVHELVHDAAGADGHPVAECPLMRVAQGAQAYRGEDTFARASAEALPVEVSAAPVEVEGRSVGAVLVFQDISERLRRERMKDDYLAFASHELRSPLTSVIGMAKWLSKHIAGRPGDFDDDTREAVETLEGEADRMASIVELFLDLSRIESDRLSLELDAVDLREVVDEEAQSFTARHPEVRLESACPEGPLVVRSDRMRLRPGARRAVTHARRLAGRDPGERQRRRHSPGGAAAHLRALLPGLGGGRAEGRTGRRAIHQQPDRAAAGRPLNLHQRREGDGIRGQHSTDRGGLSEPGHLADEVVRAEGLVEVRLRLQLALGGSGATGGQDEHRNFEAARTQLPVERGAVHHRHLEVEDDDVGFVVSDPLETFATVGGAADVEPAVAERQAQHAHQRRVIVDDEHVRHLSALSALSIVSGNPSPHGHPFARCRPSDHEL